MEHHNIIISKIATNHQNKDLTYEFVLVRTKISVLLHYNGILCPYLLYSMSEEAKLLVSVFIKLDGKIMIFVN